MLYMNTTNEQKLIRSIRGRLEAAESASISQVISLNSTLLRTKTQKATKDHHSRSDAIMDRDPTQSEPVCTVMRTCGFAAVMETND